MLFGFWQTLSCHRLFRSGVVFIQISSRLASSIMKGSSSGIDAIHWARGENRNRSSRRNVGHRCPWSRISERIFTQGYSSSRVRMLVTPLRELGSPVRMPNFNKFILELLSHWVVEFGSYVMPPCYFNLKLNSSSIDSLPLSLTFDYGSTSIERWFDADGGL